DVKIFDFDRSTIYHPAVERNFMTDIYFCGMSDQCSEFSINRDLSSIFSALINVSESGKIMDYIRKHTTLGFRNMMRTRPYQQYNAYGLEKNMTRGSDEVFKGVDSIR